MIVACPGRAVVPVCARGSMAPRLALAGLMAGTLALSAPPAQAQTWSGAVGVSSENIYRGIGQSRGDPSLFANLYLNIDGNWVAGVAASSVHPEGRHADTQVSLQLDRRWRLNPDWSARIGVAHYDSTHASNHAGLRYDELAAAVSWRGRWTAQLAWSPRVNNSYSDFVEQPSAWLWAETGWHQPLGTVFSFDVGLGYADAVHGPAHDYQYANLGFNVALGDASISIGRIWTSERKFSYELFNFPYELTLPSRQRWVASVMWLF